jgi:hypothetical protein
MALSTEFKSKSDRMKDYKENQGLLKEADQRKWLVQTGRAQYLDFKDEEIKKLRECFDSLDDDG